MQQVFLLEVANDQDKGNVPLDHESTEIHSLVVEENSEILLHALAGWVSPMTMKMQGMA